LKDDELQEIVEENNTKFKLMISDKIFKINKIKVFENENPITEPTTRGGVYVSDVKEMKIQATIFDTNITKYLSNAMLGPNKTFLDILITADINNGSKISLITNLTNTIQNPSKIVLYFIIKDVVMESD
tara:strand:- start:153 stop:539 length:387 start_codon:yes stop_codon:yes gene_type:complete